MHAITIHDIRNGLLAFDLLDILKLYEADIYASSWKCRNVWCIHKDGRELHLFSEKPKALTGKEMLQFATEVQQTIDGEFIGTREGESRPWLVVVAEDSTYYVVLVRNLQHLELVKSRFNDVRDSPLWGEQYA
jgi:hypothetical protein